MKRLEAEVKAKGLMVFAHSYLARRHSVGEPTKTAVTAMTAALHAIATKATTAP